MRGHGSRALEEALELAQAHGADDQVARVYSALVFTSVRNKNWPAVDRWLEEGLTYPRNGTSMTIATTCSRGAQTPHSTAGTGTTPPSPPKRPSITRTRSSTERGRCWCSVRCGPGAAIPESGLSSTKRSSSEDTPAQRQVPLQLARTEAAFLEGELVRAAAEIGALHPVGLTDRWIAGSLAVWRRRLGWLPEETGPVPRPYALELAGDYSGAAAEWERLECPYNAAWVLTLSESEDDLRRSHEALLALGARPATALARGGCTNEVHEASPAARDPRLAVIPQASRRGSSKSSTWSPRGSRTEKSQRGSSSPRRPSATTSPRSCASSASAAATRRRSSPSKIGSSPAQDR